MQDNVMRQRNMVHARGCWDDYADAQRLVAEGNRLIAREMADGIRSLWRRGTRLLNAGQHGHVPPI